MSIDAPQTETLPPLGKVITPGPERRTWWRRLRARYGHHGTLLRFSSASVVYSMATMLTGFVVLRWIDPSDLGLWQSIMLLQVYSAFIQGGILNGLNRELPYSLGAGDDRRALELAGTAQTVALAGAVLLLLGGGIAVPFAPSTRVGAGIAVIALCAAVTLYRTYLGSTYRAERAFELLARIRLFETVLELATLPLVYFYGYAGLAGRYLCTTIIGAAVNHWYRPLHAPVRFSWHHALTLLKVGVPIFSFAYLFQVSDTFPRVILLRGGGVALVGLFAPAYAVMSLLQVLPTSLSQYIYPHMSYRLGKSGDPRELWPIAWKTAVGIIVISLPLLAVGELVIPWLVGWWFPKYIEAVPAVRWGMITGIFVGAATAINALSALKAWRWLAAYTTVRFCSAYLVPLALFYYFTDSLVGVAVGFLVSQGAEFRDGHVLHLSRNARATLFMTSVLQRLLRTYIFHQDVPCSGGRLVCQRDGSEAPIAWKLLPDSFRAIRESDQLCVSVREDVAALLRSVYGTLDSSYLNMLLVDQGDAVVWTATQFRLAGKIIGLERPKSVASTRTIGRSDGGRGSTARSTSWREVSRRPGSRSEEYLCAGPGDSPETFFCSCGRRCFPSWTCSRCGGNLAFGRSPDILKERVAEESNVLWVAPATTSVRMFEHFLRVVGGHPRIRSIRLMNTPYIKPQERSSEWDSSGDRGLLPFPDLFRRCFATARGRKREVAEGLAHKQGGDAMRLVSSLRVLWKARLLRGAVDAIWESIFRETPAQDRPMLAFATHWSNPGVTAFRRAVMGRENVKTVYLQHGLNYRVYYPLPFDAYWVLSSEDRDYLQSFGIDRSRITMINRETPVVVDGVAGKTPDGNSSRKLFFVSQYTTPAEPFTREYVVKYLERLAAITERLEWELIVRPHPAEKVIVGFDRIQQRFPSVRLVDTGQSLRCQVEKEQPAVAATFFSTGVLEALEMRALPVLVQIGLEAILENAAIDFDSLGVVIRDDRQLETQLTEVLTNARYRATQFARVWQKRSTALAELKDLSAQYCRELDTLMLGRGNKG